jgi:signal peptidase II
MADARVRFYGLSALVFAADRLTKWIVETRMSFFDTYKVIPGFFDIVHSQNRGVAFGLFNDGSSPWQRALLIAFPAIAVVALAVMLWKPEKLDAASRWGFALILGGALGNVFDRAMWGHVTDFLEVYLGEHHWPTFNVADSAIVIGSGLLILDMLRSKPQAAGA